MDVIIMEEWSVVDNPFTGQSHLSGRVYNHPTYRDGIPIVTSPIVGGISKDKLIRTLSGSFYSLGKVNEVFLKAFPDAEKELWKSVLMLESAANAQSN